jgi:hypothetical protein
MACVSSWKAARNMTKHAKPDPQPPPGKQVKPNSQPPSGRIAFDERGNAIWQWGSDVDTQQVKALKDSSADSLSIEDEHPGSPVNHDPYSTASRPPQPFRASAPPQVEKKPQRRTLDDMRRLSEEIKRQRELKKP